MADSTESWSPRWAQHVEGSYERPSQFSVEETRIDLKCNKCGDTHRVFCRSGHFRQHIARYAMVHLHKEADRGR